MGKKKVNRKAPSPLRPEPMQFVRRLALTWLLHKSAEQREAAGNAFEAASQLLERATFVAEQISAEDLVEAISTIRKSPAARDRFVAALHSIMGRP